MSDKKKKRGGNHNKKPFTWLLLRRIQSQETTPERDARTDLTAEIELNTRPHHSLSGFGQEWRAVS